MPVQATEQAVAGTKLFIGDPTTNPIVYTEIESVANIGALGTTFAKIAVESVGSGYTRQIKGTESHPEFPLVMNRISGAPGQAAVVAASKDRNTLFPFKLTENDTPAAQTATVTVTIAAPGVFSDTAHGLAANAPVKFTTTGSLPTGLTAGTTYYVKSPTTDAYSVSATPGGVAITTTGTQSGVHTRSTVPQGTTATFLGRVYGSPVAYGAVNDLKKINTSVEVEPDSLIYTAAA